MESRLDTNDPSGASHWLCREMIRFWNPLLTLERNPDSDGKLYVNRSVYSQSVGTLIKKVAAYNI